MSDKQFNPSTLVEGVGRQVTLRVVNEDEVIHNLTIPAIPADLDFEPGQERTVIFVTPPTSGVLEFFCKFHREEGMQGGIDSASARRNADPINRRVTWSTPGDRRRLAR